jgi:hypothetical protein
MTTLHDAALLAIANIEMISRTVGLKNYWTDDDEGEHRLDTLAAAATEALQQALAQPESAPVAIITECPVMGQQTVTEIEGRWKFLRIGDKLYTAPVQDVRKVDTPASGDREALIAELRAYIGDLPESQANMLSEIKRLTAIAFEACVERDELRAELAKPESEPSKDAAAVIEIDKVMLHAAHHWPDVDSEAMIVRHVKFLTRMLSAEVEAHSTLVNSVAELRRQVRTGWLTGIEDWRRLYDPALLVLLGCTHFQDLHEDAPLPIQKEHITDGSPCWCYPEVDYTDPATGASVIIHKEPQ